MRIKVFSSGSKGNATLVSYNNTNILIDCGITKKDIDLNLNKYNLTINDLDALLITHEHTDHVKSLSTFLRVNNLKIYMSKGTYEGCKNQFLHQKKENDYKRLVEKYNYKDIYILNRIDNSIMYNNFSVNDFVITPLLLSHDANETVGFLFQLDDKKMVYIADTGYVHEDLFPIISNADAYIFESNHDPDLLMNCVDRPYPLRVRISSEHGHLSNELSMTYLTRLIGDKTKVVMHAHVSEDCNLSQIIESTRKRVFESFNFNPENVEFVILKASPAKDYEI